MLSRVYCIIPVHNRLEITRQCVEFLAKQDYANLHIVIVDDGSTDGTSEYLAAVLSDRFHVLTGNGELWWGGAMRLGIAWVLERASEADYLLMLNDDVQIESDYVSELVKCSRAAGDAMVGSVFCDEETRQVVSCGSFVDYPRMTISKVVSPDEQHLVNALSGRGVLIPVHRARRIGNLRSYVFRHYFSDFEYTARLHDSGCPIVICDLAPVFASTVTSDALVRGKGLMYRYLSSRSKDNFLSRLVFFSSRGPVLLRLTALPRYALMVILRFISRNSSGNNGARRR